jgi:acetyl-CoA decarbonylase/synthase complex subunit delta
MAVPDVKEKYASQVNEVTIGATAAQGGTRSHAITVGGSKALPFLTDATAPNRIVIAMDVLDNSPEWPEELKKAHQDVFGKPGKWAKRCVEDYGADMVCVKLDGIDPDGEKRTAAQAVQTVKEVLEAVKVPILIWGCGNDAKDNEVMPAVSQAAKGERCLLGTVTEDNYKTLTAVCLADGHNLIGQAPLDINIGKQVNVLVSDMDFPMNRLVMFQVTGALGYGLEYVYSIQERARLAALSDDKMMQCPVICDCGHESWRAKEAKTPDAQAANWGPQAFRGPVWEATTALLLMQSGVDIIRMRHPAAVAVVKRAIAELC